MKFSLFFFALVLPIAQYAQSSDSDIGAFSKDGIELTIEALPDLIPPKKEASMSQPRPMIQPSFEEGYSEELIQVVLYVPSVFIKNLGAQIALEYPNPIEKYRQPTFYYLDEIDQKYRGTPKKLTAKNGKKLSKLAFFEKALALTLEIYGAKREVISSKSYIAQLTNSFLSHNRERFIHPDEWSTYKHETKDYITYSNITSRELIRNIEEKYKVVISYEEAGTNYPLAYFYEQMIFKEMKIPNEATLEDVMEYLETNYHFVFLEEGFHSGEKSIKRDIVFYLKNEKP